MEAIVVLITSPTEGEAERLSALLLERRLVACVNMIPGVSSNFWWEGNLDRAEEVLLIAKSEGRLLKAIVETVREAHSYEVPEVIALPVIGGNPEYLQWVTDSVLS